MDFLKWNFNKFKKFFEEYGFFCYNTKGSHFHYAGKINGEEKIVQLIFNKKEKSMQSSKTEKIIIRNSGIPKDYFKEWDDKKIIHKEIIF